MFIRHLLLRSSTLKHNEPRSSARINQRIRALVDSGALDEGGLILIKDEEADHYTSDDEFLVQISGFERDGHEEIDTL